MKTLESLLLRLFGLFLHPGLLVLGLFETLGGLLIFWWINQPDTPAINKTWFGYLFLLYVSLLAVATGCYIISRWYRFREEDREVRRMYA